MLQGNYISVQQSRKANGSFRSTPMKLGTALALLIINLIGYVLGPMIAGNISDLVAGDPAYSLRVGLSVLIPMGFLGAWLMWRGGASLAVDRDRLATVTV